MSMYNVLNKPSKYVYFYLSKALLNILFCLFLRLSEVFSVYLKRWYKNSLTLLSFYTFQETKLSVKSIYFRFLSSESCLKYSFSYLAFWHNLLDVMFLMYFYILKSEKLFSSRVFFFLPFLLKSLLAVSVEGRSILFLK